jgi:hypothetical protein
MNDQGRPGCLSLVRFLCSDVRQCCHAASGLAWLHECWLLPAVLGLYKGNFMSMMWALMLMGSDVWTLGGLDALQIMGLPFCVCE